MDESLFVKHFINLKQQKNSKEEIIIYIKEKTGIEIEETTINLSKKHILFQVSSVLKQKLHQINIAKILEDKGYTCRL